MNAWKSSFVKLSQKLGWDIRKHDLFSSEWLRLVTALQNCRVTMALDVGANTGQFAGKLRRAGFRGRIVSFEPLAAAHAMLTRAASGDTNWMVAPRVALADHEATLTLNVAGNSVSSSVLPMLSEHLRAEPESRYVTEERVRCVRLDEAAAPYLKPDDIIFLKLDVQGYEQQVLNGAQSLLGRVTCLRLELSLVPLYDGQMLYEEMIRWVVCKGFTLWGLEPAFVDPNNGKMLQLDGLFCRSEKPCS
jgi:FkbM family methyltransferase